jgi:hypothetical protein
MKLSAEQYRELAASFGLCESGQGHERRRAGRVALNASATCSLIDDGQVGEPRCVQVKDFSPRGLGIIVPEMMHPGSQFVLTLARQSGGNVSILCTVAQCRPCDQGFLIGAELTCTLPSRTIIPDDDDLDRVRRSVLG